VTKHKKVQYTGKSRRERTKRPPITKINEYYYQTTNNINISVDLEKDWRSAKNSICDKTDSLNVSNFSTQSVHSKKGNKKIIENIKQTLPPKKPVMSGSAKKVAGKHISIVLNTQNADKGDDIDIKISRKRSPKQTFRPPLSS